MVVLVPYNHYQLYVGAVWSSRKQYPFWKL